MVREIRVYYEGDPLLRTGFLEFFKTLRDWAREQRCGFQLISAKGTPIRDFGRAIESHTNAWNILLKDSEGPVTGDPSASLCQQHAWDQSHADSIFWMVQMMESWFHADKNALKEFYGDDFRRNALKANPNVEEIPKQDLIDGLRAATKDTQKGNYFDNKAGHGSKLLGLIDPDLVRKAAPNCKRLFEAVLGKLA
jgi:hypothetical protein